MPAARLSIEKQREIARVLRETGSVRETARRCGVCENAVQRYRDTPIEDEPVPDDAEGLPDGAEALPDIVREMVEERKKNGAVCLTENATTGGEKLLSDEEAGDTRTQEFVSDQRIRTLEDAIAFAEVDLAAWVVRKWSCTAWEQGMKLTTRDTKGRVLTEKPHRQTLWRVKVELERILPKPFQDATEALFIRLAEVAPTYKDSPKRPTPKRPHMLELDLFDVHFGKLAWAPETSQNYDLRIAERVYRNAVRDLIGFTAGFEIERVLLPLGSDFYHVDTNANTTTSGTPVDTDGRYAKIIEAGEMAVIWAIETLLEVAPVQVVWVPGNHDRVASFHLCRTIAARFHNNPSVTVDHGPKVRKYVRYGASLIGLTHGHMEKHASLPVIMATEAASDWAETSTHEVHIGHFHRAKQFNTPTVDTIEGVIVRTLRSLSGCDSYHFERGYVGSTRAAECHLLSKESGYVGHFLARARE